MKKMKSIGLAVFSSIIALAVLVFPVLPGQSTPTPVLAQTAGCGLSSPAFCDPLNTVFPNTGTQTRAGDLNGLIWGVSRSSQQDNFSQGLYNAWADTQMDVCGTTVLVPAGQGLTKVCNGHMVEGQDDNTYTSVQAYYPRQPFDFASRTGKATFDVTDDTQGTHTAWPTWMVTDQPIPAPGNGNVEGDTPGMYNVPRNAIGVEFAGAYNSDCTGFTGNAGTQPPKTGVSSIWIVTNYVASDVPVLQDNCVTEASTADDPAGMNHVEIDVSSSLITIFMSNPGGGQSGLVQVAHAPITAPLTRGLTWMEDWHYNADKVGNGGTFHNQRVHTFAWANFGFDGPRLTGDLGFEINENNVNSGVTADSEGSTNDGGLTIRSLGWPVDNASGQTWTFTNMTGLSAASGALLEFSFFPWDDPTLTYVINGHTHTYTWSGTPCLSSGTPCTFETNITAIPLTLAELSTGSNTLSMTTSTGNKLDVSNLDIILAGAGGSYIQSATNITPSAMIGCLGPSSSFLFGGVQVSIDPNNHNSVFWSTEDCSQNYTLWNSTNAGVSWTELNPTCCSGTAINPANSRQMYGWTGVRGATGFYTSSDGGNTWTTPSAFSAGYGSTWNNDIYDVAVDPSNFNHFLITFHSTWPTLSDSGVVESTDGGATFTAHQAPTTAWASSMFVFFLNNSSSWLVTTQNDGMWKTTNSGTSWAQASTVDMQHGGDNLICTKKLSGGYCDPTGIEYVGALHEILQSTDGSSSFTVQTPESTINGYYDIGYDGFYLLAQPANTGNNAGVGADDYKTSLATDGATWTDTGVSTCFNGICDGPYSFTYDPVSNVMYSSNWGAGLWKLQLAGAGTGTINPTPTPTAVPTSTPLPGVPLTSNGGTTLLCSYSVSGSSTSSVNFPSACSSDILLGTTLHSIRVVDQVADDSTTVVSPTLEITLNSDTGNNYQYTRTLEGCATSGNYSSAVGIAYGFLSTLPSRVTNYAAHGALSNVFEISNAGSTVFDKQITSQSSGNNGNNASPGCLYNQTSAIVWRPSTPSVVTSFQISVSTGHFLQGSHFDVYEE